jgi:hypothetical protein
VHFAIRLFVGTVSVCLGIAAAALALRTIVGARYQVEAYLARRRGLAARRLALEAFARRPKAKILKVGTVEFNARGQPYPSGFDLDCRGGIPAVDFGPDLEMVIGGYTVAELLEIARAPSEFVDR